MNPEQHQSVVHHIVDRLLPTAGDVILADARVGLGYTAVLLQDGRAGLAFTFRQQAVGGCSVFRRRRPLAGSRIADLLALATCTDPLEAAIGLACANALINSPSESTSEGDVLERLDLRSDDDVAMVGWFGPLIEPLRNRTRSLTIYEQDTESHRNSLPAHKAIEGLGHCHIAILTSTCLLNGTADGLLQAARGCREVVLLGASTPLLPEVFQPQGVTMLSGVVITDADEVLRVVSEAGGTRQFSPYVRKVVVPMSRDQTEKAP